LTSKKRNKGGSLSFGEIAIIMPEGSDAKRESRGLENLFERPQVSRQTWMSRLMERKSTRCVETGGKAQTSGVTKN
jgi:hypothetical protein